jgi:DNA-binding NarL/FixJ family response regulator
MKWSILSPLRIALLDDHPLILQGFSSRLASENDFHLVGAYSSSTALIEALRKESVDILVLDYSLHKDDLDGLNLLRLLRIRFPRVRILISSSLEMLATISMAIRAGARGYIGKGQSLEELVRAIRIVGAERIYLTLEVLEALGHLPVANDLLGPGIREEPMDSESSAALSGVQRWQAPLSLREQEVIRCCLEGHSVSQIADKFSRSLKTISGQKQSAFRKLGISSDRELFKVCNMMGWT